MEVLSCILERSIRGLIGNEGAAAVQGLIKNARKPAQGAIATAVGIVTLLVGATTVFGELQSDLARIWRVPARKGSGGIWMLIRTRVLSFGMVIGIGFLLLVSLIASAILSALGNWWLGLFHRWIVFFEILNVIVSFALITVLFAMIYKFLPRISIHWRDVWIGALVTALLFTAGKFLIGLYLGRSSVASGFGAAGSVVVLMVWVYFATQIFLLGAEFTSIYACRYGSQMAHANSGAFGSPSGASVAPAPQARSAA